MLYTGNAHRVTVEMKPIEGLETTQNLEEVYICVIVSCVID